VQPAGRLDHPQLDLERGECGGQLRDAGVVVGHLQALAGGVNVAVERRLGDVDADDGAREDRVAAMGGRIVFVVHGGFPALPCGCELPRGAAFDRLFGLGTRGRRRSRSVTASLTPGHDRSAGGRRFAGFSLRFEAREPACWIEHDFTVVLNIQGTEDTEGRSTKGIEPRRRDDAKGFKRVPLDLLRAFAPSRFSFDLLPSKPLLR
jgi:hypothetical protein